MSAEARQRHTAIVKGLLFYGLTIHERCIAAVVGSPITIRVTVPSLGGRVGVHPFTAMALELNAVTRAVQLVTSSRATADRVVVPTQFQLDPPVDLTGHHVLVLDDTWTTGSRAQSASMTLRAAGARAVSIMVVGRWIDPGFSDNAVFIRERLRMDYDPDRCPVTGGACPGR